MPVSVIIRVTSTERPRLTADQVRKRLGGRLPDGPSDPAGAGDELAEAVEPGLMAMSSGRFFGWIIGGILPADAHRLLADHEPARRVGKADRRAQITLSGARRRGSRQTETGVQIRRVGARLSEASSRCPRPSRTAVGSTCSRPV